MNIVKKTREIAGMNQIEMADLIGVTRRQIINLEHGNSRTTKQTALLMIAIQTYGKDKISSFEKEITKYYLEKF